MFFNKKISKRINEGGFFLLSYQLMISHEKTVIRNQREWFYNYVRVLVLYRWEIRVYEGWFTQNK